MNTENLKKEIKKVKVWHIALLCAGVFIAFAVLGGIFLACGGGFAGWHWGDWSKFPVVGIGKLYDVNDHAALDMTGVSSVKIITISDSVTLSAGDGTADLKGQCRSTGDPVKLSAHKDGSTLTIEVVYPHSNINNSSTALTVAIPASYSGDLSISTTSGDVHAQELPHALNTVRLHSISGGINFGAAKCAAVNADTVSGNINISGIAGATDAHSTSGGIELTYNEVYDTTVGTVSGGVVFKLPAEAKFGVDFHSVSGSFRSTLAGMASRADRSFQLLPGGAPVLKVGTVSGDCRVEGK